MATSYERALADCGGTLSTKISPAGRIPSPDFVRILGELTRSPQHQRDVDRRAAKGVETLRHLQTERLARIERASERGAAKAAADAIATEIANLRAKASLLETFSAAPEAARKWLVDFVKGVG